MGKIHTQSFYLIFLISLGDLADSPLYWHHVFLHHLGRMLQLQGRHFVADPFENVVDWLWGWNNVERWWDRSTVFKIGNPELASCKLPFSIRLFLRNRNFPGWRSINTLHSPIIALSSVAYHRPTGPRARKTVFHRSSLESTTKQYPLGIKPQTQWREK